MAANNGRGRAGRPADFKYTDTIADKASDQGILVKQDLVIDAVNQLRTSIAALATAAGATTVGSDAATTQTLANALRTALIAFDDNLDAAIGKLDLKN